MYFHARCESQSLRIFFFLALSLSLSLAPWYVSRMLDVAKFTRVCEGAQKSKREEGEDCIWTENDDEYAAIVLPIHSLFLRRGRGKREIRSGAAGEKDRASRRQSMSVDWPYTLGASSLAPHTHTQRETSKHTRIYRETSCFGLSRRFRESTESSVTSRTPF